MWDFGTVKLCLYASVTQQAKHINIFVHPIVCCVISADHKQAVPFRVPGTRTIQIAW